MTGIRRIVDLFGEVHQTALTIDEADTKAINLNQDMLGIVLQCYVSDKYENRYSHQFEDRHAHMHVADVLIVDDGSGGGELVLPHVVITPNSPAGIDNYEEYLPRGCSSLISGEKYDTALHNVDQFELDGDWCIVRFIGGIDHPYVSRYWPNPRNTYDTQTSGEGNPNSAGVGTALVQSGRYFKRTNGVESVITPKGDIFISTHFAGSRVLPSSDPARGRFARELVEEGGGIRLNVKPTGALELNWNVEEDGIGTNDLFDPSLPQENPPKVRPTTAGSRDNTFIRVTQGAVSLRVPQLFNVESKGRIQLESFSDSDIIVGGRLDIQVEDFFESTITNDIYTTSEEGNMVYAIGELQVAEDALDNDEDFRELEGTGHFQMWTENDWKLISENGVVDILTEKGNISLTAELGGVDISAPAQNISLSAGSAINVVATGALSLTGAAVSIVPTVGAVTLGIGTSPLLLADTYTAAETTFLTALGTYLALCTGPTPGDKAAIAAAISAFTTAIGTSLSTKVFTE